MEIVKIYITLNQVDCRLVISTSVIVKFTVKFIIKVKGSILTLVTSLHCIFTEKQKHSFLEFVWFGSVTGEQRQTCVFTLELCIRHYSPFKTTQLIHQHIYLHLYLPFIYALTKTVNYQLHQSIIPIHYYSSEV